MEESSSDRQSALFSRIFPVLVLGFAGGFFDSYTYVARGGVFCNAQTSNLLLMILGLASGRGVSSLRYLVPVAFFVVAIFLENLTSRFAYRQAKRKGTDLDTAEFFYHLAVLVTEILFLTAVGLIPVSFPDILPNALVSSVAAMQFNAFRTMRGIPLSTVFCTNNLRMFSGHVFSAVADHDKSSLKKAGKYLLFILFFLIGVAAGYFLTVWTMQYAILFISALLTLLCLWALCARRAVLRSASAASEFSAE